MLKWLLPYQRRCQQSSMYMRPQLRHHLPRRLCQPPPHLKPPRPARARRKAEIAVKVEVVATAIMATGTMETITKPTIPTEEMTPKELLQQILKHKLGETLGEHPLGINREMVRDWW